MVKPLAGVTVERTTAFPGLSPRPARPARTSSEASGAAVSSGGALMKHGGLPGGAESARPRSAPAPSRARSRTDAAVAGLARPGRPETPDEGREVGQMGGWDLGGSRQMLQAVHRSPWRQTSGQ